MFATLEEKAVVVALALLALAAGIGWLEHLGYARCTRADSKIVAAAQVHAAAVEATDLDITHAEASSYAASAQAPVLDPVHVSVGLCHPAGGGAVPDAAPPGRLPDAHTAVRAEDHRAALPGAARGGTDIGPGLQAVGQDADARVIALQDYINRVCLAR